ncbi:hypothetical protein ACFVHB_24025 [Kitasatospora sp. NPDC127111]|uniref:effector-associated constant component EACC1 n=1 Tax=Kitasatospora sp. NPDC127111 TaxID=3345363 RepID=UPI00364396A2
MRIVVSVEDEGQGNGADGGALHELRRWLAEEPGLRGRVGRAGGPSEPGSMGLAADALVALLEPGGVAAVFAGAVVAWVRTRRAGHTLTITRPDGSRLSLSTRQVKGLTPQQMADLVRELTSALDGGSDGPPTSGAAVTSPGSGSAGPGAAGPALEVPDPAGPGAGGPGSGSPGSGGPGAGGDGAAR